MHDMKPKPVGTTKPVARSGPEPSRDWAAIATHLRRRPGVWFEIAHLTTHTNDVWRIKTGANPAFREGQWDAMRESTPDGYVLYACYLGEA